MEPLLRRFDRRVGANILVVALGYFFISSSDISSTSPSVYLYLQFFTSIHTGFIDRTSPWKYP